MPRSLSAIFEHHVASSFDKQLHLAEVVGESDWGLDVPTAVLSFESASWHVQVLGTQSDTNGTWMWAWANTSLELPREALRAAESLRGYGQKHGISELVEPTLAVEPPVDGHYLSLAACGMLKGRAYYRGPYDGGAVFLVIDDPAFPPNIVDPLSRIATVFPQVISTFPCDHRRALSGYATYYGLAQRVEGDRLLIEDGNGSSLAAKFDAMGRIVDLRGRRVAGSSA